MLFVAGLAMSFAYGADLNAAQAAQAKTPKNKFIGLYKPSAQNAGAAVAAAANAERLPGTAEACAVAMLKGHKVISWISKAEYGALSYVIKRDLRALRMRVLKIKYDQRANAIIATPKGYKNALLLKKYLEKVDRSQPHLNHYLIGTLLNYSHEDVFAFYERNDIVSLYAKHALNADEWLVAH